MRRGPSILLSSSVLKMNHSNISSSYIQAKTFSPSLHVRGDGAKVGKAPAAIFNSAVIIVQSARGLWRRGGKAGPLTGVRMRRRGSGDWYRWRSCTKEIARERRLRCPVHLRALLTAQLSFTCRMLSPLAFIYARLSRPMPVCCFYPTPPPGTILMERRE